MTSEEFVGKITKLDEEIHTAQTHALPEERLFATRRAMGIGCELAREVQRATRKFIDEKLRIYTNKPIALGYLVTSPGAEKEDLGVFVLGRFHDFINAISDLALMTRYPPNLVDKVVKNCRKSYEDLLRCTLEPDKFEQALRRIREFVCSPGGGLRGDDFGGGGPRIPDRPTTPPFIDGVFRALEVLAAVSTITGLSLHLEKTANIPEKPIPPIVQPYALQLLALLLSETLDLWLDDSSLYEIIKLRTIDPEGREPVPTEKDRELQVAE